MRQPGEIVVVRPARREDAGDLARLADLAGEGLPRHLWARIAGPGEAPEAVGRRRAARDEGAFSWRNALVAELGGVVAGAMAVDAIGMEPEPLDGMPAIARPLQALENRALGRLWVAMLATYPACRRRGVAARLLAEAETLAAGRGLGLIVADGNEAARRLYRAAGYREAAQEAIVKEDWPCASSDWILLLKPGR